MSLWYTQHGSRSKDTGQFRSRAPLGTKRSTGSTYREWHYDFVSHQTGTTVKRTSYGVTIFDPQQNRVEYLRGFSSLDQAREAATKWIDDILEKMGHHKLATTLGTIPPLPTEDRSSENLFQEK